MCSGRHAGLHAILKQTHCLKHIDSTIYWRMGGITANSTAMLFKEAYMTKVDSTTTLWPWLCNGIP